MYNGIATISMSILLVEHLKPALQIGNNIQIQRVTFQVLIQCIPIASPR